MRKGFTLFEVIITVFLFSLLAAAIMVIFKTVILNWASMENRIGIEVVLDRGIEEISRDLREAKLVQSSNDEIRYTPDNSNYYIYYLYNAADSYPCSFNKAAYQLRKATLAGGINGSFSYGSGQIILTDILPPSTSDLSLSSGVVNVDLSVSRRNETVRTRTKVKPRNL